MAEHRTWSKFIGSGFTALICMEKALPPIPAKRYFTIGEVGELCGVKPHVLRYWEQEFTQLRPMKRRGNRRYYQHHEVLMIRRIRELLYDQGFTISGARNKLQEIAQAERSQRRLDDEDSAFDVTDIDDGLNEIDGEFDAGDVVTGQSKVAAVPVVHAGSHAGVSIEAFRKELMDIRALLLSDITPNSF